LADLVAAAQVLLVRQRTALAGVALGVSLLVKPLALPWLVVLACRRTWAGTLTALLVVIVGWSIAALRFGSGPLVAYVTQVLPSTSALYANEVTNLSWWTIGPRLFRGTSAQGMSAPPLVDSPVAATLVGIALPCLMIGLACLWLMLARPQLLSALGVFTGVALIGNPICWAYYLGLAVLPAARVARTLPLFGRRVAPWLVAGLCVGLLIPVQDDVIQLARQVSAWSGAPAGGLTPVGSLVTLGPGVGVAGLAALVAYCDRRLESVPLSTDSKHRGLG